MRVIAGKYGSRPLQSVPGDNTRPTSDKVRESLFNSLGGWFQGGQFLDLYGGTGAVGIEAVSRGMDRAVFTEKNRQAIKVIATNIAMTKEKERFYLLSGDKRRGMARLKHQEPELVFDWVFLDPPYGEETIVNDVHWLDEEGFLGPKTVILCETDGDVELPEVLSHWELDHEWHLVSQREYRRSVIYRYERKDA